jgi:predicted transport protein
VRQASRHHLRFGTQLVLRQNQSPKEQVRDIEGSGRLCVGELTFVGIRKNPAIGNVPSLVRTPTRVPPEFCMSLMDDFQVGCDNPCDVR